MNEYVLYRHRKYIISFVDIKLSAKQMFSLSWFCLLKMSVDWIFEIILIIWTKKLAIKNFKYSNIAAGLYLPAWKKTSDGRPGSYSSVSVKNLKFTTQKLVLDLYCLTLFLHNFCQKI